MSFTWAPEPQAPSRETLKREIWPLEGGYLAEQLLNLTYKVVPRSHQQKVIDELITSGSWVSFVYAWFQRLFGLDMSLLEDNRLPTVMRDFFEFQELRYGQTDSKTDQQVVTEWLKLLQTKYLQWLPRPQAHLAEQFSVLEQALQPFGYNLEYTKPNEFEDNSFEDADAWLQPVYRDVDGDVLMGDMPVDNVAMEDSASDTDLDNSDSDSDYVDTPGQSRLASVDVDGDVSMEVEESESEDAEVNSKAGEDRNKRAKGKLRRPKLNRENELAEAKGRLKTIRTHVYDLFYPIKAGNRDVVATAVDLLVDDVVWLKDLRKRVYSNDEWLAELKSSGLLAVLIRVCAEDSFIERTHEDILVPSFRRHDWKLAFKLLLDTWYPLPEEPEVPKVLTDTSINPTTAFTNFECDFFQFWSNRKEMHPWSYNPMAAFALYSAAAFEVNWCSWIRGPVSKLSRWKSGDVANWNPRKLYDSLMGYLLKPRAGRSSKEPQWKDAAVQKTVESLDPRLFTVITETVWQRQLIQEVQSDFATRTQRLPVPSMSAVAPKPTPPPAPPPNSPKARNHTAAKKANRQAEATRFWEDRVKLMRQRVEFPVGEQDVQTLPMWWLDTCCVKCQKESPERQCGRNIEVFRKSKAELARLKDYAITHAVGADILRPDYIPPEARARARNKKSKKKKGKGASKTKPQHYISPDELGLSYYESRPTVRATCGRDITRFWCEIDGKCCLVGGVSFGTFSEDIMEILEENHSYVQIRGLRRRAALAKWSAIGTMTAFGSRLPNGGVLGDIYNAYAAHSGITAEDLHALMRQALTIELLVEGARAIWSGAPQHYKDLCLDAELNLLGRYGLTGYHCENFLSTIHADEDIDDGCLHPCFQLAKENCTRNDFNFAYVEYGVAVRTERNAEWLFDGNSEHASIMPSVSSMEAGARSAGTHASNNRRNVQAARRAHQARTNYPRIARANA
ncbi:hypothetical protein C8F01DRAFT_1259870 [Mycena amicta]|nr:hypothetical protein C8F01DRAFT_1259870 [Mycena amicta]